MHARLDDDLGVGLGRLTGERERIPDEIGDAVEDFRRHVIMGEDDRVALALQRVDGGDIGREHRPFDGRHHGLHPLVKRVGRGYPRRQFLSHGVPYYTRFEYIYGIKKSRFKLRHTLMLQLSI